MNIRENVMSVFHRETPERIPWLTYDIAYPMLPRGAWERELRNMGLGIIPAIRPLSTEMPNVEIEQRSAVQGIRTITTTTYHTPVGTISKKEDSNITPPNPWIIEYPVKGLSDYDIVKFIFEDTIHKPNYEAFTWIDKHVGSDGYVRALGRKPPFLSLLLEYMGYERLSIDLYRNRKEVEDLMKVMEKKYFEAIQILAESPAEVVGLGGNINGRVMGPKFFEKYLVPTYFEASEILHKKDKITQIHMDGALACLKDSIPKTGIDVVEAFTPPPIGDLPLAEARQTWGKDLIIAANFPATVCLQGVDAIKRETLKILKSVAPGDGFILSVTEDIPYKEPNDVLETSLRSITEVMWKHGSYPIKL